MSSSSCKRGNNAKRRANDQQNHPNNPRSKQRHNITIDHTNAKVAVESDRSHEKRTHRNTRRHE